MRRSVQVVSTPEQWYKIVHGPMAGVVVSDRGRTLFGSSAEAACYAWNGPPGPNAFGHVSFRNGDSNDKSFKNVFWATISGKPQVYDLEVRSINGDLTDSRPENLFLNENPQLPAACWAIKVQVPTDRLLRS